MTGLDRELAAAAFALSALVATLVLPTWIERRILFGLVAVLGIATAVGVRAYRRAERSSPTSTHAALKEAIGTAGLSACGAYLAVLFVGIPLLVAGVAIVAIAIAALERSRLRGPLEVEGTLHAVADTARLPGLPTHVAMWVARQAAKRWSSGAVEVRNARGTIRVDLGAARVHGRSELRRNLRLADEDDAAPIEVWWLREGEAAYVVGRPSIAKERSVSTFRGVTEVDVLAGAVVLGAGRLASARRGTLVRIALWIVVFAAAGFVMAAGVDHF